MAYLLNISCVLIGYSVNNRRVWGLKCSIDVTVFRLKVAYYLIIFKMLHQTSRLLVYSSHS